MMMRERREGGRERERERERETQRKRERERERHRERERGRAREGEGEREGERERERERRERERGKTTTRTLDESLECLNLVVAWHVDALHAITALDTGPVLRVWPEDVIAVPGAGRMLAPQQHASGWMLKLSLGGWAGGLQVVQKPC